MNSYEERAQQWCQTLSSDPAEMATIEQIEAVRCQFAFRVKMDTGLTEDEKEDMHRAALVIKDHISTLNAERITADKGMGELDNAPPPPMPKSDGGYFCDAVFDSTSL